MREYGEILGTINVRAFVVQGVSTLSRRFLADMIANRGETKNALNPEECFYKQGELDALDSDNALYAIAYGAEDHLYLGSLRLIPTTQPHMLSDVVPHLLETRIRSPEIWELSRLCMTIRTYQIASELLNDIINVARHVGVKQIVCVASDLTVAILKRCGLTPEFIPRRASQLRGAPHVVLLDVGSAGAKRQLEHFCSQTEQRPPIRSRGAPGTDALWRGA